MEDFSLVMPDFDFFGIKLTCAVPLGWIVTLVLILFMVVIRISVRRFKEVPGAWQNAIETVVGWAEKSAKANIPEKQAGYIVPYVLVLILFIGANSILELIGIEPVTSSLSTTFAMGLFTFFWINWYALRIKGFKGRMKALANPIKVITDCFIPVSMGCRLFGNVLAGTIVMSLLYGAIPILLPAAVSVYFSIIHMVIQGYIFITLTLSFIEENIE